MITGADIVCISSIDWDFLWQGHQQIMAAFAAHGNRVLYVENTGVRRPTLRDLPRLRDRLCNWWRGTKGFREERPNLFVYSPIILPFPYSRVARWVNRAIVLRALERWARAVGVRRPIAWTFLPTPLARDLVRGLEPALVVYYCIDDLGSSSPAAARVRASEDALFREADLVFVTSEKLRARAAAVAREVHLFPFGVDYPLFARVRDGGERAAADLDSLPRPVAGYVGGVHRFVDQPLLAHAARALPDVTFVLVGPIQTDVGRLAGVANVRLLGARPHADLPRYLKGFDVALVPYVVNEYTTHVYPTKLNEYLAMGLPVVGVDLPELRRFNAEHGETVALAGTAEGFTAAIRAALQDPAAGAEARTRAARRNGWDARIERMSEVIDQALASRCGGRPTWETVLRRLYWRARRRVVTGLAAVLVGYLALFASPLPWLVALPLWVAAPPRRADAVVVFAGGVGESGKAGGGYQERVKHAVDLYRAGYASRIVFSSGYVFAFREAEVMRDLALAQGVDRAAITVEPRAANTRQNALFVAAIARREGWRSVLLVSSPYHMRRALGAWRRAAPDVDVIPAPVPKSQFYAHDGPGASQEQVWAIGQEYAALVVYWWRGWL